MSRRRGSPGRGNAEEAGRRRAGSARTERRARARGEQGSGRKRAEAHPSSESAGLGGARGPAGPQPPPREEGDRRPIRREGEFRRRPARDRRRAREAARRGARARAIGAGTISAGGPRRDGLRRSPPGAPALRGGRDGSQPRGGPETQRPREVRAPRREAPRRRHDPVKRLPATSHADERHPRGRPADPSVPAGRRARVRAGASPHQACGLPRGSASAIHVPAGASASACRGAS